VFLDNSVNHMAENHELEGLGAADCYDDGYLPPIQALIAHRTVEAVEERAFDNYSRQMHL
jgi:hypothetical protein